MGVGSWGGGAVNVAATSMMMRNIGRSRDGYSAGLPPESPKDMSAKEVEVKEANKKRRFILEPYLTNNGYCFWSLYKEVTVTVGFWEKREEKKWEHMNNYASQEQCIEAARHSLKEPKIIEL